MILNKTFILFNLTCQIWYYLWHLLYIGIDTRYLLLMLLFVGNYRKITWCLCIIWLFKIVWWSRESNNFWRFLRLWRSFFLTLSWFHWIILQILLLLQKAFLERLLRACHWIRRLRPTAFFIGFNEFRFIKSLLPPRKLRSNRPLFIFQSHLHSWMTNSIVGFNLRREVAPLWCGLIDVFPSWSLFSLWSICYCIDAH